MWCNHKENLTIACVGYVNDLVWIYTYAIKKEIGDMATIWHGHWSWGHHAWIGIYF